MAIKISVLIIICFLTAGCGCSENENVVKVDPDVPFANQATDYWCAAACVEMMGRWTGLIPDGIRDEYKNCPQCEIIAYCDDDWSGALNTQEFITAMELYATGSAEFYQFRCPTEAPTASRTADQHLMTSFCHVETDSPNIMYIIPDYSEIHAIIVTGFTGEGIKEYGYAVATGTLFNDPADTMPGDAAIGSLKNVLVEYYDIYGFTAGIFIDPVLIELSNEYYMEFIKYCGTYYGGPDSYIPEGSTFVRIRYPNAEESFPIGITKEIRWESNGFTGPIRLELQKDDLVIGTIAENLPIGNGSYNWEVGEYQGGSAQTGNGYKIRVSMMDDSFNDTSNLEFSISQPSTLTVTSPNGGESWKIGSTYNITWNAANLTGNVKLTLLKDDAIFGPIVSDIDAEAGFYTWTIGKLTNGRTITPGSEYKIKIKLQGEDVSDISDATFNISDNSEINVNSPNGGENWQIGSNRNITWTAAGVTDTVTLYLFENNSNRGSIKTNLNPAAGSYTWTVGNLKNGTTVSPGSSYKIKIESQGEPCSDYSDAPFTLSESTQIPVIWLSKESVTYTVSKFDPVFSDSFEIKNSGAGTLQYMIYNEGSGSDAIGPSPNSGSSSGEIDTINITVYPQKVSPGAKTTPKFRVIDINNNASNSPRYINFTIYGKPLKVSGPNPANGATNIDLNQNLSWSAAEGAVKYNVYFGTDSPVYKTTTTNLNWTYTGTMYYNNIYKWRIDSVDSNDKITTGDEWNFTTKQSPTAISINLGDPDQDDHVFRFDFPMGYTEPVTITERDGSVRRTKTLDDPYMCFKVSDDWAYQGFLPNQNPQEPIPQLAITIIYLDNGTGYLELQYDSTGYEYKCGGIVYLQDTNIWMSYIFYVSDAYFGNRQNDGGDFRIARNLRGGLLYLADVHISR